MPKPKRSTPRLEYYLEATDKAFGPARTSEHAAEVVTGPGACRKDVPLAGTVPSARVVVTAAAGAPAVPAGFLPVGLVTAGSGLSAGVLAGIIGGGAAAGGAVVVATLGDDEPTPPEEPPSIAGSWVGTGSEGLHRDMVRPDLVPMNCRREDDLLLDLQQSGAAVTGTARLVRRAGTTCDEPPFGPTRTYEVTGTRERASVRLTLVLVVQEGERMHVLVGAVQGARMSGTATTTTPGATGQGTWSVLRP